MKEILAFAYLYNYYAVPEEYDTPEAFSAMLARRPTLTLTRLVETGCIAPYFIEEETVLCTVKLDRIDRIHPIVAYLMPRDEYADRLRELIRTKCPGCLHFTPPRAGEPLDITGHEREMTLDGLCLLRAEARETYTLIDAADSFWHDLLEAEDSIRKPLYDRDYTEAADALSVLYARYFRSAADTLFAVNRVAGKHLLLFGALNPEARMVVRYVISRAPAEVTEYWTLFDYLPAGACRYEAQSGYDLTATPPTVEFTRLPGKDEHYALDVFCPPAAGGVSALRETYRYLCTTLGEDLLMTRAAELRITVSEDCAAHKPLHEWTDLLQRDRGILARSRISRAFAQPTNMMLPEAESGSRPLVMRIITPTLGLALELSGREFNGRMRRVIDDWDIPLCSLELTLSGDFADRQRQTDLVTGELIPDLQKDSLIMTVNLANSGEKLYIDFYATAAGETTEAIRDLAPEFAGMNPRLTVRDRAGTRVMQVSFTMDTVKYIPAQREETTVS